jgi:hypothetical protein
LYDVIGFKPQTSVKEGVKNFVDWYRNFYRSKKKTRQWPGFLFVNTISRYRQIAGINFIRHIRQLFRHAVRDDHIRFFLEASRSRTTREWKNSSSCITGS